ncbi:MAG: hypothetical protein HY301_12550 [Verrucomicrobia bacterium]|nr:hypothetical protein [Verrucomicrobiota bacterium]
MLRFILALFFVALPFALRADDAAWLQQKGTLIFHDAFEREETGNLAKAIVADESGPTDRITLDDEFEPSTWLSSMLIKEGKAHFLYFAHTKPPRQHHVRYDIATGKREGDHRDTSLKGGTLALTGLDGFFVTKASQPGSPLYCIARDVRGDRIVCLISRDNDTTWHDHAVSSKFHQPYAIGGCREITPDGFVIGSFTELEGTETKKMRGGKVWFFKVNAE